MRKLALMLPLAAALALTGCTSHQPAAQAVPSASSGAPSPASATPPRPTPTTTTPSESTGTDQGEGCPANDEPVPDDADVQTIEDVDRDGQADIEFFSESDGFRYGIHTASGATIYLPDDLAGPNQHHGWTSIRETAIITVLDDGRTATLHAFLDCAFVTTTDTDGRPYSFGLNGFTEKGTGVECTDDNGGALLAGVLAARQADGTYDIEGTIIDLSDGGRIARNGSEFDIATGGAESDSQVRVAMRSTCGDIPIVSTSGK